jgi:hypothetical protein
MFLHPAVAAVLALALVRFADAHDRHFAGHPEWDDLWPDPVALNDLRGSGQTETGAVVPPDLTGVWALASASAASADAAASVDAADDQGHRARVFLTASGGGYGSAMDREFAHEPALPPGFSFDVRCVTADYASASGHQACAFAKGRVTLAIRGQGHARAGPTPNATTTDTNVLWVATVTLFDGDGQVISNTPACPVTSNTHIATTSTTAWTHFTGPLSGLWQGAARNGGDDDYYLLAHSSATDALTVSWDTSETPAGSWTHGVGSYDRANQSVRMVFDTTFVLDGAVWVDASTGALRIGKRMGDGTLSSAKPDVGWRRRYPQKYPVPIHTVHLIFANHLDIGYTTTINDVLNEYLHPYFTHVADLADEMRSLEGTDRFTYMTHPWLMSLLLDCPCPNADPAQNNCSARSLNNPRAPALACPTPGEIKRFKSAVAKGDIYWHAAPMNNQFENMSPALVEAGLKLTRWFDAQFYGPDAKHNETITMSDRDVIYVTRSMIPFLSEYGVEGLTIGSNGANYPPQVPKLHVWREPSTGKDVIVVYHPYGYGGYSKSTCAGPGHCGSCAEAPNGVAICTEFRTDNTGPPVSTDEILTSLNAVRQEYPNASVFSSSFDNFIRDVLPVKSQLPVVTHEVGDTWMYGAPSDPLKMAQSRELQRAWEDCLAREKGKTGEDSCDYGSSAAIRNMSRFLMKCGEHTWGTPGISGWGGSDEWDKKVFTGKLNTEPYLAAASSWAEQRIFNALAVAALEEAGHPLAVDARRRYDAVSAKPGAPDVSKLDKLADPTSVLELMGGNVQVGFDATGAMTTLRAGEASDSTAIDWASADKPLAALVYQTLNESDWKPFTYDYINGHSESKGFCKFGSNNYTVSKHWRPTIQAVYSDKNATVVVHMKMPQDACEKYGGAPTDAYLNVTVVGSSADGGAATKLELTLTMLGKTPTMIGESTMLTFAPAAELLTSGAWSLDKLGYGVDPEDVLAGGNQFNHGVWSGGATAATKDGAHSFNVVSLDASNMCPQTPDFPWGNPLPAGSSGLLPLTKGSVFGMGMNLHNNLVSDFCACNVGLFGDVFGRLEFVFGFLFYLLKLSVSESLTTDFIISLLPPCPRGSSAPPPSLALYASPPLSFCTLHVLL